MFAMDILHLGDFDSSQEAIFHFRFFTSMSRRPVFSETRVLRVSLALIKVIQQDVLRAPGMLLGSPWPSLARTLTKTMWFFAKMPKINNFFVNMHLRGQNLDVPEVPIFRVKIHKNVNSSALASSRLLKLHKSSGISAVRTKLQEF